MLKYYPVYFIMILVMMPPQNLSIKSVIAFVLNLFLLQSYVVGNASVALTYNWPTWFLSSIMLSYFFSALLNKVRYKVKRYCGFVMALVYILQLVWAFIWREYTEAYDMGYYMVYIFPLTRMLDFFQGMLLYSLYEKRSEAALKTDNKENTAIGWTIAEAAILLLTIGEFNLFYIIPKTFQYSAMWVPTAGGIIWIFVNKKGPFTKYLSAQEILQKLGAVSFELYIVHRPVLVYFEIIVGTTLWSWISAFVATIIVSCLAHMVFDSMRRTAKNKAAT